MVEGCRIFEKFEENGEDLNEDSIFNRSPLELGMILSAKLPSHTADVGYATLTKIIDVEKSVNKEGLAKVELTGEGGKMSFIFLRNGTSGEGFARIRY